MSETPASETRKETSSADFPTARNIFIGTAGKLADAATLLGLVTAAMYFWGYVYYAGFCERLGVPFRGITLSFEEYLVASYQAVFVLLTYIGIGLVLLQLVITVTRKAVRHFERSAKKDVVKTVDEPAPFLILGASLFVVVGILLAGGLYMIMKGGDSADKTLESAITVVIRDAEGKPIEGRFIYLRDFGSALLVAEMSRDGKQIVANRLLKASSYSGYSLMKANP